MKNKKLKQSLLVATLSIGLLSPVHASGVETASEPKAGVDVKVNVTEKNDLFNLIPKKAKTEVTEADLEEIITKIGEIDDDVKGTNEKLYKELSEEFVNLQDEGKELEIADRYEKYYQLYLNHYTKVFVDQFEENKPEERKTNPTSEDLKALKEKVDSELKNVKDAAKRTELKNKLDESAKEDEREVLDRYNAVYSVYLEQFQVLDSQDKEENKAKEDQKKQEDEAAKKKAEEDKKKLENIYVNKGDGKKVELDETNEEKPTPSPTPTPADNSMFDKYDGLTLGEAKEKAIQELLASDGIIDEAKKDGVQKILRAKTQDEFFQALANFNPQGPVDQYPTVAKYYNVRQLQDGGYLATVGNKEYTLNSVGDVKGGFANLESRKSFDSQKNALVAKFATQYKRLPIRTQAEIQNKIQNIKKGDTLRAIAVHKELNAELRKVYNSNEQALLDEGIKYLNDSEALIKGSASVDANGQVVDNNNNNLDPNKEAANQAKTGVAGMAGVVGTLTFAGLGLAASKKNKKKDK